MLKRKLINVFLLLSLLSFPLAVFASGEPPSVITESTSNVSRITATLTGSATGDNLTNHGFEYGKTTAYGSNVQSANVLPGVGYVYDSNFGDSEAGSLNIGYTMGLAVDAQGSVYVADNNKSEVKKFDVDGKLMLTLGTGTSGSADGQFDGPKSIAVDNLGNIYVGETYNHRIQKFDAEGNFISKWGAGSDPNYNIAYIYDLKIDNNGYLWAVDSGNYQVLKFDTNGNFVSKLDAQNVPGGYFNFPTAIDFDATGNIYVAGHNSTWVNKFDSSENYIAHFDTNANGRSGTNSMSGFALDNLGNMIVSDTNDNRVQVYDQQGNLIQEISNIDNYDSNLYYPVDLVTNSNGELYIASTSGSRIKKFTYQTQAGTFKLKAEYLECETTYHYRSFATNEAGTSVGEDQTFTTGTCLAGPTNLAITTTGKTAKLTWDPNPDIRYIDNYNVHYRKVADASWQTQLVVGNEASISGLDSESEYEFKVLSVSTPSLYNPSFKENSAWSSVINGTTGTLQSHTISSCLDLQSIGMNPTTFAVGDMEGHYVLTGDIDCAESVNWRWANAPIPGGVSNDLEGFFPIMDPSTIEEPLSGFRGELDGAGFKVSNITQKSGALLGIFETLQGATVKNITFDNLQIGVTSLGSYAGGLASYGSGSVRVDNVVINGTIQSLANTGPALALLNSFRNMSIGRNGNLYFVDDYGVKITDPNGYLISEFNFPAQGQTGYVDYPVAISGDSSGNFYVADGDTETILKFSSSGTYLMTIDVAESGDQQSPRLSNIAIDSNDNIFVSDQRNANIKKFNSNGTFISKFGTQGQGDGEFSNPSGIAFDSSGNIYVSEMGNDRVQKFNSSGQYISKFGSHGDSDEDGKFYSPFNIAIKSNGNIVVAQTVGHKVSEYSSDGSFVKNIGTPAGPYNYSAFGIAADSSGNLYVADTRDGGVTLLDDSGNLIKHIGSSVSNGFMAIGGFVGMTGWENETNTIEVTRSKSSVNIIIDDQNSTMNMFVAGGVIGFGLGEMKSTVADGEININGSNGFYVGGLSGYFAGAASDVHASNKITLKSNSAQMVVAGGLFGMSYTMGIDDGNLVSHEPHVESSYAWGTLDVTVQNETVPKMIGGIAGMFAGGTLNDTFSAETITVDTSGVNGGQSTIAEMPPTVPISGLVGMIMADPADVKNNSFDQTLAGTSQCFGMVTDNQANSLDGSAFECVPVNSNGSDPDHYKNNNIVEPLDTWDFTNSWDAEPDEYPQLVDGPRYDSNVVTPDPIPIPVTDPVTDPEPTPSTTPNTDPGSSSGDSATTTTKVGVVNNGSSSSGKSNGSTQILPSLSQLLKKPSAQALGDSASAKVTGITEIGDIATTLERLSKSKAKTAKELAVTLPAKSMYEKVKSNRPSLMIIGAMMGFLIAGAVTLAKRKRKLTSTVVQNHNPFNRLNK